ncbi:MAG TPA: HlyD family efflux transporter periplasmic adaptor subunit [Nevskiaceae bacterium]|nr:HlyD family efflux transporter periplasmic adaptor subunit [Nevskiaceae bacterium]
MNAPNPNIAAAQQKNGARRKGLLILGTVVAIGLVIYSVYWLAYARHFEETDDAYVASDLVQITSEVPGTVLAVGVDDTQSVQRGQLLLQLDPADAKVALDAAEAELARNVRQVRALFAQASQLKAQLSERQADYDRRKGLTRDGAVSKEELSHAQTALEAVQEQLQATLAQTEGTTIATHPQVLSAEAKVRDAALALKRTQITAPVAGVVAKRSVQVGARIAPGAPLMAVVPLDDVWVDANFKEVQLENMRVGQPVTLRADVYGRSAKFHGHIAGLSAGSGSAFALLPAQNASGNWIKVVQRVPVRIALDRNELAEHPLRVGLSMAVQVDVRDASGPLMADKVRGEPHPQIASDEDDKDTEAQIAKIVADNSGASVSAAAVEAK